MTAYRRGYVLFMWTGCFPINRYGQPTIYSTEALARKALQRFPAWGHDSVTIYHVRTRPGSNGKRDYIVGDPV